MYIYPEIMSHRYYRSTTYKHNLTSSKIPLIVI